MDRNKMTAKQYLSQAYRLDERINSKLEQLGQLKMMATNITSNLSEICVQKTHNNHQMEDTIVKIIEQEQEIDDEIDALVDRKRRSDTWLTRFRVSTTGSFWRNDISYSKTGARSRWI